MFKKKKTELVRKTIFNIPSDEAKVYLSSIIKDVKTILNSEKYVEATKRVKLPENATIKDYENIVKRVYPQKVYNFLTLFVDDCFDEVRRILSAIFVTDFDEYKNKSIEDMCKDISTLSGSEISRIIGFFRV
jgi:hypothetical protein